MWLRPNSSLQKAGNGRRRRPWLVLSLGFGGLLLCVVTAAAGTLLALARVRNDEAHTRQGFLERLASLDQIRSEIYLSGTYVRDFLLAPDSAAAAAQTSRLAELEHESHSSLKAYSQSLEAEERKPFLALRSEIEAYWRVLDGTMAWSPGERNRLRYSFFYNELVPRRTAMLQIADRIASVHERGLSRAEGRSAASADSLRRSLEIIFAITFLGGLALALATIGSTLRLERELERRLSENLHARRDLQELSARLLSTQENERRSLARELHDEVGQSLSAILMEADSAECAEGRARIREHLESIRKLAEKTVGEVRDLALLLRPSMLDDLGLVPALNWHAREMAKRTGLNVLVRADGADRDLPEEHKTCIYRMVQEATNNSARHASARTVEVVVRRDANRVLFTIQDDGAGFDPRHVRGLGLLGMEERVRRLGGRLTIDSQPGRGTLVSAELPLVELARKNGHEPDSNSAG